MPLPLAAFAAGAAAATGALVRAAQVGALDEGPEYIRDGEPDSPLDAVGLFAARQACKVYANNPGAINDRPAAAYERVCRPFLDNIGYGDGPTAKKPFEGGQCASVNYRINWSWSAGSFNSGPQEAVRSGPLTFSRAGTGSLDCGPNGGTYNQFTLIDGTGQSPLSLLAGCGATLNSLTVTRVDGLPDTCGNPPPEYTEPQPPDEPETGPRPFIFAPDFNFDVDVNLDVDGRISIDIGTGPIVIDPFGDGGDDGGGDGGGGEDAPGTPEPGPELPGGNGGFGGDDGFGAPPAGKRWIGACIRIAPSTNSQPPIPGSPPDDVYPTVIGNIRLVGAPGGSRLTDTPIQIRAKHVCVWEPVRGFNPTAVSVDLLPGYGYTYRPYAVPEDN